YFPARGGIVVGIKGQDSRLPLGSLGDGMRRLMAIATSLAFTKNGCLFVDEIDTGLHYSVMPDMWKLVIAKAGAANVQVFATTHSWDCIEGLSLLCQREPNWLSEVAIHKIDRALPSSVAFSRQSLVRMLKHDIDPRS
ncbi:MAG TPA: AAA family ATPase, partial [Pirellulales bacterium]|nr:AAA family ATPase [Pirellulales bacterium]